MLASSFSLQRFTLNVYTPDTFASFPSDDRYLSITNKKISWLFTFEDKEQLHNWLVHLIQHAADHRSWKQAASRRMRVLSPQAVQTEKRTFKRTRSKLVMLYNDID